MDERLETTRPSRAARLWLWLLVGLATVFCGGILLAPYLEAHGARFGSLLRLAYRPGCHQQAERCLDLGFGTLAVCARCAGLYAGGLLGLLWAAVPGWTPRPRPRWLLVAIVVNVIDVAVGIVGLPSLANWPRFAIAVPVGLLSGLFLATGVVDAVDRGRLGPATPTEGSPDPVQ